MRALRYTEVSIMEPISMEVLGALQGPIRGSWNIAVNLV